MFECLVQWFRWFNGANGSLVHSMLNELEGGRDDAAEQAAGDHAQHFGAAEARPRREVAVDRAREEQEQPLQVDRARYSRDLI